MEKIKNEEQKQQILSCKIGECIEHSEFGKITLTNIENNIYCFTTSWGGGCEFDLTPEQENTETPEQKKNIENDFNEVSIIVEDLHNQIIKLQEENLRLSNENETLNMQVAALKETIGI